MHARFNKNNSYLQRTSETFFLNAKPMKQSSHSKCRRYSLFKSETGFSQMNETGSRKILLTSSDFFVVYKNCCVALTSCVLSKYYIMIACTLLQTKFTFIQCVMCVCTRARACVRVCECVVLFLHSACLVKLNFIQESA